MLAAYAGLYDVAVRYQIHHDAIMWTWRDKIDQETIDILNELRAKLFASCEEVRKHFGVVYEAGAKRPDEEAPLGADERSQTAETGA